MFQSKLTNKKFIYGIIVPLGLIATFFIWSNYLVEISERPKKLIKPPALLTKTCGIENCHGVNITCGPNVPENCTMMYQSGDNCRRLVSCQMVGSSCQLVTSLEFDACKSCVKNCEKQFGDDATKYFSCESQCGV